MCADPIPVVIHLKPWGCFDPHQGELDRQLMVEGSEIPISDIACAALDAHESGADIYELANGRLVTYGDASGRGKALCFINPIHVDELFQFEEGE